MPRWTFLLLPALIAGATGCTSNDPVGSADCVSGYQHPGGDISRCVPSDGNGTPTPSASSSADPLSLPTGSGVVFLNDTQRAASLTGCLGCGHGIEVTPGGRYAVRFPPNRITLHVTSAGIERCLVVINGVESGDLLLRASGAGRC